LATLFISLVVFSASAYAEVNPSLVIPDEYIVVLKRNTTDFDFKLITSKVSGVVEAFMTFKIGSFRGFSAKIKNSAILNLLENSELVDYIEPNQQVFLAEACTTQDPATWGLSRIAHLNTHAGIETLAYSYSNTGSGVTAYVVDTGIEITHPEFEGRATWGANYVDTINSDCNGHGTHVAGTIGSATYGVAKGVSLVAVKVLGCSGSGSYAGVIQGVQYTTNHCASTPTKKCVSNMSLGGSISAALDDAITAAVAEGIVYVVAAGNSNANACLSSPARTPTAITVAATYYDLHTTVIESEVPGHYIMSSTYIDIRAYFSNHGTCVDIAAPGQQITSTWTGNGVSTISGTSMASPHVCGVTALAFAAGLADASTMTSYLQSIAVKGVVQLNCGGNNACEQTPNYFLQSTQCVTA